MITIVCWNGIPQIWFIQLNCHITDESDEWNTSPPENCNHEILMSYIFYTLYIFVQLKFLFIECGKNFNVKFLSYL